MTTTTTANLIGDATRLLCELRATICACEAVVTRCGALGEDVTRTDAAVTLLIATADRIARELGDARRASPRAELAYVEALLAVQRDGGVLPRGAAAGWLLAERGLAARA